MISVFEVVVDPDMIAPQPFTIMRSTGKFVLGGFESTVTAIPMFGPVQQASNKELLMLAEADRIGSVLAFWCTCPIYTTRGYAPVPGVHSEAPQGSGMSRTLSVAPPNGEIALYVGGLLLIPNVDYTLNGEVITFTSVPVTAPYAVWQVMVEVAASASDILEYDEEKYRVLNTYYDPGGGYYKALGTRLAAA